MNSFNPNDPTTRSGIEKAAALLEQSRAPVVVVNRVDLAGAAAAIALAQKAGAVLDHAAPTGLGPSQEQGTLGTVPGEAYLRADLVIVAGPITDTLSQDAAFVRLTTPSPTRSVVRLGSAEATGGLLSSAENFRLDGLELVAQLGVLNALAQGRPVNLDDRQTLEATRFVEQRMTQAKYGVFVFAPDAIDAHAQFMMMALANVLSAETRWSVLPLGRPAGQAELIRMCQALTGLPPPLSFAGRRPVHDPLLYRAVDVIGRRETDAILWVSACEEVPPDWISGVPLAAVTARPDAILAASAQINIGQPGIDYPALTEGALTGVVTAHAQTSQVSKASAAQVIEAIAQQFAASQNGAVV